MSNKSARSVKLLAPIPPHCHESGCPKRPEYVVTTSAGELPFCARHAEFYIERGQAIYPVRPWGQS